MRVPNLARQSSGYCFRMTMPHDLKPIIGKRELRYALNERSLSHAKRKSKRIAGKVKDAVSELRREQREGHKKELKDGAIRIGYHTFV
jgi:Domain of unknown function (DUF6538)